jgi:predicted amidohydrolase
MTFLPVVLAQTTPVPSTEAASLMRDQLLTHIASFPQTRLVVYPELQTCRAEGTPEQCRERYEESAEPLDGPLVSALSTMAREAGVWFVPGTVVERGDNGELFNTTVVFDPSGELVACYRKIFPWRPREPFDPGEEFATFDIPDIGRVGLAICYDLWFPEVIRQLAWLGAETVLVPTQTSTSDRRQEIVLAQAAAIQNQVHVVSLNAAAPFGTGGSLVVDPEGLVRVQAAGAEEAVLTDVLDFNAVRRVRTYGTCALNRLWSQAQPGDPVVNLPMYAGTLDPTRMGPLSPPPEGNPQ